MPARLPDFLGLGTQKGGTTSLHQWLNKHPQVYLPPCKEVHYFDINMHQTIQWYGSHFENATAKQQCGEITPFYLFHPHAAARIKEVLPQVKMIVLLRDPVERALSQVFHAQKRGFENLSLNDALAAEKTRLASGSPKNLQKNSYLSRSRYLEQLDRYEKLFKKHQLLILKSEEMFTSPETIGKEVTNFLGLQQNQNMKNIPNGNIGSRVEGSEANEARKNLRTKLLSTALGIRERYGFGWDWAL